MEPPCVFGLTLSRFCYKFLTGVIDWIENGEVFEIAESVRKIIIKIIVSLL